MKQKLQIHEILSRYEMAESNDERKAILIENDSPLLRNVLQGTYHPDIKYVIKEEVPYKKQKIDDFGYISFQEAMNKVYIFTEGSRKVNPNLKLDKKVNIFIRVLESLDSEEAVVFMNMVLKDLKTKRLSAKVVKEVFPGLLP